MSTLAGQRQTLRQPLYDAPTVPAAGGANITTAFQNATTRNRGYLTNLEQDGRLPNPDAFELFSPRIVPALASAVSDKALVVSSFTQIWANQRTFFEGPAWLMPGGVGITSEQGGIAAATATSNHGAANPNAVLNLGKKSLQIRAGQSFRHLLDFTDTTLPAASVVTHFVWDGLYSRQAQ